MHRRTQRLVIVAPFVGPFSVLFFASIAHADFAPSNTVVAQYQVRYGAQNIVVGPTVNQTLPITSTLTTAQAGEQNSYTDSLGVGNWNVSSSASPGLLHISTDISNHCFAGGAADVLVGAGAQFDDTITVNSDGSPGLFLVYGAINGTWAGENTSSASFSDSITLTVTAIDLTTRTASQEIIKDSVSTDNPDGADSDTGHFLDSYAVGDEIEISGSLNVSSEVMADTTPLGDPSFSDTQGKFGDTAFIVIQSQTPGVTFTSASGYAYTPIVEAPEPATLLVSAALFPLLFKRRSR